MPPANLIDDNRPQTTSPPVNESGNSINDQLAILGQSIDRTPSVPPTPTPTPTPLTTATANPTIPYQSKENIYTEICSQIIQEQEKIIGILALEEADRVEGLRVDHVTYHCIVTGDGSKVIDDLIGQYRDFFGHAAVEVCKEAASKFINKMPSENLPLSLR